jgi:hypothetical protein
MYDDLLTRGGTLADRSGLSRYRDGVAAAGWRMGRIRERGRDELEVRGCAVGSGSVGPGRDLGVWIHAGRAIPGAPPPGTRRSPPGGA